MCVCVCVRVWERKRESDGLSGPTRSHVCCPSVRLSVVRSWEKKAPPPSAKAPERSVTQWAVKMLIQQTRTHTHTQVIQHADTQMPVGSNSCSGARRSRQGRRVLDISLFINLLFNKSCHYRAPSGVHTHMQWTQRCTARAQNTHSQRGGCQAWQIGLFDPVLLDKRGESHE